MQIDQVAQGFWQPFQSITTHEVYMQQLAQSVDCCWQASQLPVGAQVCVL